MSSVNPFKSVPGFLGRGPVKKLKFAADRADFVGSICRFEVETDLDEDADRQTTIPTSPIAAEQAAC